MSRTPSPAPITEMRVLLEIPDDDAFEHYCKLPDDSISVWSAEHNQIDIKGVTHAATTIGGGVHIHRDNEGNDDLHYPPTDDTEADLDDPIQIISSRPMVGQ